MAGDDPINQQLVDIGSMILEFDDSYRYAIQDAFGEINSEAMRTEPAKELVRVIRIIQQRGNGISERFKAVERLIPFMLRIKVIREFVDSFFAEIDLKKMALDDMDFYRCMVRTGYEYRGLPDAERISLRMMIDADWQNSQKAKH
jgi:hypothetical protein